MFLFRAFMSFCLNALTFVLGALARELFFPLAQSFLLDLHRIISGDPRSFNFGPARFFFCSQSHQLNLQLGHLLRHAVRSWIDFRGSRG